MKSGNVLHTWLIPLTVYLLTFDDMTTKIFCGYIGSNLPLIELAFHEITVLGLNLPSMKLQC